MKENKRQLEPMELLLPEDLADLETLEDKTEAILENRAGIFLANVDFLRRKRGLSQNQMCETDLQGSPQPSQLAAYKHKGKDIPFRIMARVAAAYGYPVETLCGRLLQQERMVPEEQADPRGWIGTYELAWLEPSDGGPVPHSGLLSVLK